MSSGEFTLAGLMITGFFAWLAARDKGAQARLVQRDSDIQQLRIDRQDDRAEIDRLSQRVDKAEERASKAEARAEKLGRRVTLLERILRQHDIPVPEEEED